MTDTSTHTGGGIANVISGIIHTPAHIVAAIESVFTKAEEIDPALKEAILPALPFLKNTIATVVSDIKTHGAPVLAAAQTAIVTDLTNAATGTVSKGAAGNAAIATIKTAGTTLADDTLHILTTDLLTDVAGLVKGAL